VGDDDRLVLDLGGGFDQEEKTEQLSSREVQALVGQVKEMNAKRRS